MRELDRKINEERYPYLFYPEIYLLHDGYKSFFSSHKEVCHPMEYTPMDDPKHEQQKEICITKNQNQWKKENLIRRKSTDN